MGKKKRGNKGVGKSSSAKQSPSVPRRQVSSEDTPENVLDSNTTTASSSTADSTPAHVNVVETTTPNPIVTDSSAKDAMSPQRQSKLTSSLSAAVAAAPTSSSGYVSSAPANVSGPLLSPNINEIMSMSSPVPPVGSAASVRSNMTVGSQKTSAGSTVMNLIHQQRSAPDADVVQSRLLNEQKKADKAVEKQLSKSKSGSSLTATRLGNGSFTVPGIPKPSSRRNSRPNSPSVLSGSLPRSIPRKFSPQTSSNAVIIGSPNRASHSVATPSSIFLQSASMRRKQQSYALNLGQSPALSSLSHSRAGSYSGEVGEFSDTEVLTDSEVKQIVSEHLVNDGEPHMASSFGSVSHSLLGGETTRSIYKWKETREANGHQRRNSEPDLNVLQDDPTTGLPQLRASDLQEPGMFRRFYLENKARQQGEQPPNFITRNFIDFLVLYGFYGGDVYPSDDEGDLDDDLDRIYDDRDAYMQPGSVASSLARRFTSRTRLSLEHIDEEIGIDASESTPLLRSQTQTVTSQHQHQGTSESKAFFMLLKAFVGTGVLFLPKAFSNGGFVFSTVLMLILGYLTLHCMYLLVEASRALGGKSFGDIGYHLFGERMRQLILASIAVSQMGFCCAYYIFVAANLRDWLMIVSDCRWVLPDWMFVVFQVAIYIPLAWVRRIKNFGLTSLIADVFILTGLGYIFIFDLQQIGKYGIKQVPWINLESFSLFVGTAMFAFEGICLMLPIAESMKHPERFGRVLTWSIFSIGSIFISIGALGYLALGDDVATIVFVNLPKGPVVNTIQFFYAIAIMLSFPLTIYPAIRITEQGIFGLSTGKSSTLVKWQKNLYRTALTITLGAVAWAGSSNLDKVVALVGCFACIPLSFVYPSLFHYYVTSNSWTRAKDMALVVFGIIAMIYTTYVTLQQWAEGAPDTPIDRCHDSQGNRLPFLPHHI